MTLVDPNRYLKYANATASALRSVLKGDARTIALKREEIALKQAIWTNGKQGENVSYC